MSKSRLLLSKVANRPAGGGGAQPSATIIWRMNEVDHNVTGPQDSGTKGYHLGTCVIEE